MLLVAAAAAVEVEVLVGEPSPTLLLLLLSVEEEIGAASVPCVLAGETLLASLLIGAFTATRPTLLLFSHFSLCAHTHTLYLTHSLLLNFYVCVWCLYLFFLSSSSPQKETCKSRPACFSFFLKQQEDLD